MKDPVRVIDCRERAVVELWRKGHLSLGTIVIYLQWVRRFRTYCDKRKLQETEQLTAVGARRFAKAYVGPRLKGRQSPRKAATSPAMRSMRGLARWRRWIRRCRRGAINIRRHSHRYWRSTAIIVEPTMGSRNGRWCAMSRPRVASSSNCAVEGPPLRERDRQMWMLLCGSLPPAFRDEPSRIRAVRSEGFSDFCG